MNEGTGNTTFSVPMAPAYSGGGDMFGGGMNGIWGVIILLAVLGYGNGFGFGGGGNRGYGGEIQRGFDQNAVMSGLSAIQNSQDTNQMAIMQQFFSLLSQFQNCCCEQRLGTAQLGTAIAQEGAATRAASSRWTASSRTMRIALPPCRPRSTHFVTPTRTSVPPLLSARSEIVSRRARMPRRPRLSSIWPRRPVRHTSSRIQTAARTSTADAGMLPELDSCRGRC